MKKLINGILYALGAVITVIMAVIGAVILIPILLIAAVNAGVYAVLNVWRGKHLNNDEKE